MFQYVYKPYHGWRHGYRREKWKRWVLRIARILLVIEGLLFAGRYIRSHTFEQIREREIIWTEEDAEGKGEMNSDSDGDFYGIGVDVEDGELFWFHRSTEIFGGK